MMLGREQGVVLIQVALALVVLLGFCGMVIDIGVLSTARAQAQNAADAGALAGATALAFDSATVAAPIEQSALAATNQNFVWGQTPIATATALYEGGVPSCVVPGVPPPPTPARVYTCVTVRVYRNQAMGNPLPTFFGRLVNVIEQGVQAEAVGTAVPANSTSCLWPVAIPDRWNELNPGGGWLPSSTFTKYTTYPTEAMPKDTYTAPTTTSPGSGFSITTAKLNADVTLTLTRADFLTTISAGQFVPVVVPRADGGGFANNLATCNGVAMFIFPGAPPDTDGTLPVDGTATLSQVLTAASARVTADPGASWNSTTLRITGSCATAPSPCAAISPRLVALPVFDADRYETTRQATGTPEIRVVNFVGFFIQSVISGTSIVGRLATYPGNVYPAAPAVGYISAFMRTGILRR